MNNLFSFFLIIYSFVKIIASKTKCLKTNFYELNFLCSLDKKCGPFYIFKSFKYKDSSLNEINQYENEISKIKIKKFNFEKIKKKNDPKITKEIVYRNMTYKEFLYMDDLRYLHQNEVNKLFQKKYKYYQKLPFNNSAPDEKYYVNTIRNLFNEKEYKFKYNKNSDKIPEICNGSIDVAWTFVNSSDILWQIEFNKTSKSGGANRYRDYGGLKYSMRSVYKYLKYAKNWFVVISSESQIPKFLNVSYDIETNSYKLNYNFDDKEKEVKIHFIFHRDIFPNNSVLPNFASDSIESAFAFIPNISECFVYLNDDFFIGNKLPPSFFIKENNQLNLFKSLRFSPYTDGNNWDNSVYYTNKLLDKDFGMKRRLYPEHACYFWRKSVLLELNKKYKVQHSLNRVHKFRETSNIVIPFLHTNYALEMGYGEEVFAKNNWFKFYKVEDDFDSVKKIEKSLTNYRKKVKCFCVNDGVRKPENNTRIFEDFDNLMEKIFPEKMPFEI